MDADALVAAVAEFLPVPHVPELIVEDMLADTIDIGIASKATCARLMKKHGLPDGDVDTFFRYAVTRTPQCTTWWYDETFHRGGDLPAVVFVDGESWWYWLGERHRDGGKPAVTRRRGHPSYYIKGRFVPVVRVQPGRAAKRKRGQ